MDEKRGKDDRFHFCYRTVNLMNGKAYIGKRTCDRLNDGYLGSGILITSAIKKYGRKNFKREILEFFDDSETAFAAEVQYIREAKEKDVLYNIADGGTGSRLGPCPAKGSPGELNFWYGKCRSGELNPMFGKKHGKETLAKISKRARAAYASGRVNAMIGRPKTEKQITTTKTTNSRKFDFISPEGEITTICNLSDFCRENDLDEECMRHVSKGRNKTHRGWTRG